MVDWSPQNKALCEHLGGNSNLTAEKVMVREKLKTRGSPLLRETLHVNRKYK